MDGSVTHLSWPEGLSTWQQCLGSGSADQHKHIKQLKDRTTQPGLNAQLSQFTLITHTLKQGC